MRVRMFLVVACCLSLWFLALRLPAGTGGTVLGQVQSLDPLGSAFTYQGRLLKDGAPVNGACDLQFGLWDALTGGASLAAVQTKASVQAQNGLFTVQLDLGSSAFSGGARWLEVAARCPAGSGPYETLAPRQALTAVPYALYAQSVSWGGLLAMPSGGQALELRVDGARALRLEPGSISPNLIGGHPGNSTSAGVTGATISGGGASSAANKVTDNYGAVGGGSQNQAGNNDAGFTNAPHGTVSGGESNVASGSHATISGGEGNVASGSHATVGGGWYNTASGYASTVSGGGGFDDVIVTPLSNQATASYSTVGGGVSNTVDGFAATIGGGESNVASGEDAVVSGGWHNRASGAYSAVPGGVDNVAGGNFSLAAGRQAKASHHGAFVWADSTEAELDSERNDQFRVRANGGVRLDVNNGAWMNVWSDVTGRLLDTSTGAFLSQGGMWTNASGREQKENVVPVDAQQVLLQVARLPIATWNYRAEDPSSRHMGPLAEDFAVFGLGQDDQHIGTVDADGVSLAAIQGLYQLSQEQAARIAELEERIASLEALLVQMAAAGK